MNDETELSHLQAPHTAVAEGQTQMLASKRKRTRRILIFVVVSLLNVGLLSLLATQLITTA
jgi:hypothetical protein